MPGTLDFENRYEDSIGHERVIRRVMFYYGKAALVTEVSERGGIYEQIYNSRNCLIQRGAEAHGTIKSPRVAVQQSRLREFISIPARW